MIAKDNNNADIYEELKKNIYRCQKCKNLCFTDNKRIDSGFRTITSGIMIVGKKPEKSQRKFIIGEDNKFFVHGFLDQLNIEFEDVYSTNLIKCAPKEDFDKEMYDNCKGFLKEQMHIVKPLVVITVGKETSELFREEEDFSIEKGHGKVKRVNIDGYYFYLMSTFNYSEDKRDVIIKDLASLLRVLIRMDEI